MKRAHENLPSRESTEHGPMAAIIQDEGFMELDIKQLLSRSVVADFDNFVYSSLISN